MDLLFEGKRTLRHLGKKVFESVIGMKKRSSRRKTFLWGRKQIKRGAKKEDVPPFGKHPMGKKFTPSPKERKEKKGESYGEKSASLEENGKAFI